MENWIIQFLLGLVIAGVVYFMKEMKKDIKSAEEKISSLHLKVLTDYMPRNEIQQDLNKVGDILNKLYEKLDERTVRRR